jgi:hypothetical protein
MEQSMSGVMDNLTEIFSRPEVQASLTNLVTLIGTGIAEAVTHIPALIEGIGSFITFIQDNEGILVGVFVALGVAALAWGVTTAAAAITAITPMLPVIGVLLLIAGAAYLLYQAWTNNWGGIQEKTAAAVEWIKGALQSVGDFFVSVWNNPTLQAVVQTVLSNVKALFAAFKAAFSGDWHAFGENLRVIWDNNWKLLVTVLKAAWTNIKSAVSNGIENVKSFLILFKVVLLLWLSSQFAHCQNWKLGSKLGLSLRPSIVSRTLTSYGTFMQIRQQYLTVCSRSKKL